MRNTHHIAQPAGIHFTEGVQSMDTRKYCRLIVAAALALLVTACNTSDSGVGPQQTAGAETVPAAPETALIPQPASPYIAPEAAVPHPLGVGTQLSFGSSGSSGQRSAVNAVLATTGGSGTPFGIKTLDLDGDGQDELIALAKARPYCGAGGVCNFWIFQQVGGEWQLINGDNDGAKSIFLLPSSTLGYRDLEIHGGCGTDACRYLIAWDGSRYHWPDRRGGT